MAKPKGSPCREKPAGKDQDPRLLPIRLGSWVDDAGGPQPVAAGTHNGHRRIKHTLLARRPALVAVLGRRNRAAPHRRR